MWRRRGGSSRLEAREAANPRGWGRALEEHSRGSTREAVVDTNVFTNAVVEDYPYHEEARTLLDSLNRWLVPIIVVYELAWLAERLGLGRGIVKAVLERTAKPAWSATAAKSAQRR